MHTLALGGVLCVQNPKGVCGVHQRDLFISRSILVRKLENKTVSLLLISYNPSSFFASDGK
jgi:hypothetical protein